MITKEKGYSLNVLVITIAVMLILTSTAVVTLRSLTKDRDISSFMSDLQEVEAFVMAYYSSKNILPIIYDDGEPKVIELTEEMYGQVNPMDKGEYYQVDLSKLHAINLNDYDRGGYILNENTLKIYVMKPVEYEGVKYYTLTDEIMGVNKIYSGLNDFDIEITGNPITWSSKFNLLVSIPDREDVDGSWSFKYYKNGPITAEQFATLGTFFEYGQPIQVDKNGVHSIYVENSEGQSRVVNVIVNKIDEIKPYAYTYSGDDGTDKIMVRDDELGIAKIHYKIMDYTIPDTVRAQNIQTYVQGPRTALPDGPAGGIITYEEAYTGERINGVTTADIGRSILTYKSDYQDYLAAYNTEFNKDADGDGLPDGDVSALDEQYPQFQRNGVPYHGTDDVNIMLYVEDYAGNYSVTDRDNNPCIVSRDMLINSNFIETVIKPLNGAKVVINDDEEYSKSNLVSLTIRAQGAEQMYITTTELDDIEDATWESFQSVVNNHPLPEENGEVEVYVYITASQNDPDTGELIYEKVSDSIYIDMTPPTNTAPEVEDVGNDLMLYVTCKQEDKQSGIEKVEYAYKLKDESKFTWVDDINGTILEEGQIYEIKTKATDRAGNSAESGVIEVQCPLQVTRTVPNEPAMATGMKAIIWDGTFERPTEELEVNPVTGTLMDDASVDVTWYNYEIATGINDSMKSIWANAKTSDGSYWVWIPRYAYKLIYYTDSAKTTVKGYYQNSETNGQQYFNADGLTVATDPETVKSKYMTVEIIFLSGNSSTKYKEENIKTNNITVKDLPSDYIVHPAFTRLEASAISNTSGRWSTDVTGIWVSKFEMSRADATIEEVGTSTQIKSVPSVKSYTNIKIGDAYEAARDMIPSLSSHLMKNSEWGAVAYLAHSVYGRNGAEPKSNRSSDYITGGGGTGTSSFKSTSTKFETSYAYNARKTNAGSGMFASTTGNIYGVYDMLGGAAEYVAAYLNNEDNNISVNSPTMTQTTNPSLRERFSVATIDQPINNYKKHGIQDAIAGNAIYETSTGYDSNDGINGDTSKFPYNTLPFFTRGGSAEDGSGSGLFNFNRSDGAADAKTGFRTVLAFY